MSTQVRINDMRFSAYATLCAYIGLAWGAVLGFALFTGCFVSDGLHRMLQQQVDDGLPVVLWVLFVPPILSVFLGLGIALLSYLPFRALLRATDGVNLQLRKEVHDGVIVQYTPDARRLVRYR